MSNQTLQTFSPPGLDYDPCAEAWVCQDHGMGQCPQGACVSLPWDNVADDPQWDAFLEWAREQHHPADVADDHTTCTIYAVSTWQAATQQTTHPEITPMATPRECVTHHAACDCREAAVAAEVAQLKARIAELEVALASHQNEPIRLADVGSDATPGDDPALDGEDTKKLRVPFRLRSTLRPDAVIESAVASDAGDVADVRDVDELHDLAIEAVNDTLSFRFGEAEWQEAAGR